jgi:hypothetical protein
VQFAFEDDVAHMAHASSAAVEQFESVDTSELAAGPVVFTNDELIAKELRVTYGRSGCTLLISTTTSW